MGANPDRDLSACRAGPSHHSLAADEQHRRAAAEALARQTAWRRLSPLNSGCSRKPLVEPHWRDPPRRDQRIASSGDH